MTRLATVIAALVWLGGCSAEDTATHDVPPPDEASAALEPAATDEGSNDPRSIDEVADGSAVEPESIEDVGEGSAQAASKGRAKKPLRELVSGLGIPVVSAEDLAVADPDDDPQNAGPQFPLPETPEVDWPPVPTGESVVEFEAFGPTPGTRAEDLAEWSELVHARFLEEVDPDVVEDLDIRLERLDIVDATPAFINAVRGLDMAVADDVRRVSELCRYWYDRQAGYKQVHFNAELADMRPSTVRNRMLVADGWVRWWQRTIDRPGSLDRYRTRVQDLGATLERLEAERRAPRNEEGGD